MLLAKYRTVLLLGWALLGACWNNKVQAQNSEIGLSLGMCNYTGDLNTDSRLQKPRPAISAVYRYTINHYVMLRAGLSFGMIAAADSVSNNPFQQARNLSFRSNILEVSGQVDWHFKKFIIGSQKHFFTPYLTSGIAMFRFNPKTVYNDEVYELRNYGTEGQLSDFTGRQKYKLIQPAILLGGGFKYWAAGPWSFYAEACFRKTYTDYIDDVSMTYVDQSLLGDPISRALADRSAETNDIVPIGSANRQRGDSVTTDGYWTLTTGITYTIVPHRCPRSK